MIECKECPILWKEYRMIKEPFEVVPIPSLMGNYAHFMHISLEAIHEHEHENS